MKNLIYQYWDGKMTPGATYGTKCMKEYADRIGAEYLFEDNPKFVTNLGKYSPHYGQFKVVYDKYFEQYDNILFTDTDVYPVDGLDVSIFDGFDKDVGICTEDWQPTNRVKMKGHHISSEWDEKWAAAIQRKWGAAMPRTKEGLLKVYNSGVVLTSKEGRQKMRERFVPFSEFVSYVRSHGISPFYTSDQAYIHAMLFVADLDFVELGNDWNSFIHFIGKGGQIVRPVNDLRTSTTKFVHIQLSGADNFSNAKLYNITNKQQNEWDL